MKPFDERTVIVLDLGQYKTQFQEKVPFRAVCTHSDDLEIWVTSLKTGKEYQLYYNQVLEAMTIEEIKFILSVGEYGMYDYELLKQKLK